MGVPFARSLRSLRADGFRYTLIGLTVALLLLLAWGLWFFNAHIQFWERSSSAQVIEGDFIDAAFSNEQLHRIRRGQAARFYPDAAASSDLGLDLGNSGLEAVVIEVRRKSDIETGRAGGRVSLVINQPRRGPATVPLPRGVSGRVEIEIERRTPAQLLFSAAGAGERKAKTKTKRPD